MEFFTFSSASLNYSSSSLQQWLLTLLLIISSLVIFRYFIRRIRDDKRLPPTVPGAWPLLGHLHLLSGNPPHIVLGNMVEKYGPVFTILFGTHRTIVVNSIEVAKECFNSTNDKSVSHRPVPAGIKHMFYNDNSFGFAPYGHYWREMRKMAALSLLSNQRVDMLNRIRTSQVNIWFKNLYEMCTKEIKSSTPNTDGVVVEMRSWIDEMFFHVLVNMVVKPTNNDGELIAKYRKAAIESSRLMSTGIAVSDLVPYLWWLDNLFGIVSKMKKTAKDMDAILTIWLEQIKSQQLIRRSNGGEGVADQTKEEEEEGDGLIADLLSMQDSALSGHDRDIAIKSACQVLIMGGSDSTAGTLTWVLSMLMNHRDVLIKVREELDRVVGKDRQVDDSDIKDFVYLHAVLRETMRLYPVASLIERLVVEDCIIGGFHVKAGTRLFVNVSKMHRDPNVWSDPTKFKPERFLTSNTDVDFNDLVPFGSGRRLCPAVSFSVRIMLLILGRFIHSFEVKPCEGYGIVDMTEGSGLHNRRVNPLEVFISPRLDSKIYS